MYIENVDKEWSVEPFPADLREAIKLLKHDPAEGLKSLELLAAKGSNLSMVYIGVAYTNGEGVDRDVNRGEQWYKRAADRGSIEGRHRLAYRYFRKYKYRETIDQLQNLSNLGYSPAMYCLGSFYHTGTGTEII